jgi:hypothetical protein
MSERGLDAMTIPTAGIRAIGLTKSYHSVQAVREISLEIARGETVRRPARSERSGQDDDD